EDFQFVGAAVGEIDFQDPGIVVAKVPALAVGQLDDQKPAEVGAQALQPGLGKDENAAGGVPDGAHHPLQCLLLNQNQIRSQVPIFLLSVANKKRDGGFLAELLHLLG